jgi:hypothetical protein
VVSGDQPVGKQILVSQQNGQMLLKIALRM